MIHLLAEQAVATVQVIGLAVVMSTNPGVDIVLPRVQSMHMPAPSTQIMRTSSPRVEQPQMIDDHVPIIAFPTAALRGHEGFEVNGLKPLETEGYSYVALDGEHLHFVMNGDNPPATVPRNLPRLSWGCDKTMLRTTVQINRPYRPVLNDSYKPPDYPQAAAVLNVPKALIDACLAKVKDVQRGRVDTRIFLVNDGTFTIAGNRKDGPVKSLTFDGNALVMVANVPVYFLQGNALGLDVGHYGAYYTMLDAAAAANCSREPTPAGLSTCEIATNIRIGGKNAMRSTNLPVPMALMTYECSNSQYP